MQPPLLLLEKSQLNLENAPLTAIFILDHTNMLFQTEVDALGHPEWIARLFKTDTKIIQGKI